MKLGLALPQRSGMDLRKDIKGMASTAESAGFASLWVYDPMPRG